MKNKKLGFGLMRLPVLTQNDPADIDVELVMKMVDHFINEGFTYFDTAWMYCGFNSEKTAKKVLVDRYPRDAFTLATKLHVGFVESLEDRNRIFNQQLANTGVDFFDYYLLHGIEKGSFKKYEDFDCFNWILEKKEQGLVKSAGFSFHDNAELLDEVLTRHPEMEFVQLQINYLDWDSEWIQSKKCYEVALKHGKQVIVMEPVKGGTLVSVPESVTNMFKSYNPEQSIASWAIRFAAGLENVMVVLSGMSNIEQLDNNTSYMSDFRPLSDEEKDLVKKAVDLINENIAIPCTACEYCLSGCPMKIAIPQYFSLYNENMRESKEKGWTANMIYYEQLSKTFGKASTCIECGVCESVCPQHIPIIQRLKDVADDFERNG